LQWGGGSKYAVIGLMAGEGEIPAVSRMWLSLLWLQISSTFYVTIRNIST